MDNLEHLVIDADQMIYACGFATEEEPEHHAFKLINDRIMKSLALTDCSRYTVYIKGKGNFREDIAIDYKATRAGKKPQHYDAIRDFLMSVHDAQLVNGMEADDQVSLLLFQDFIEHGKDPDKCTVILSSPDKDLKNTPGWHLNPMKDEITFISERQSSRHFAFQMLAGDRTDNIAGIGEISDEDRIRYGAKQRRCGDATAKRLLVGLDESSSFSRVGELYANAGHSKDYMAQQCNLLWMARDLDGFTGAPVLGEEYAPYTLMVQAYDLLKSTQILTEGGSAKYIASALIGSKRYKRLETEIKDKHPVATPMTMPEVWAEELKKTYSASIAERIKGVFKGGKD